MAWADEVVLCSPTGVGLDIQLIGFRIRIKAGEPFAERIQVLDKYGWRKEIRDLVGIWLHETLADAVQNEERAEIWAELFILGNIMKNVKRYNPGLKLPG